MVLLMRRRRQEIQRRDSMKRLLLAVCLVVGMAGSVWADPFLDFGIVAPTPGTISYAGGANPLVGTGIEVDNVTGLGTPLNNGVTIGLVGFALNFTTGNLTSFTAT